MYSFGIAMLILAAVCFVAGFFARLFFSVAVVAFVLAWVSGLIG